MRGLNSSVGGEHARNVGQTVDGGVACGSPGRTAGEKKFSRVAFLGAGAVAAAGITGVSAPRAKAAGQLQVWSLSPHESSPPGCGCGACTACHLHATNKIFASASDADSNRAHPHCRCAILPLALVDESVYNGLFVTGGSRASVDRRQRWVQAVLAHAPALPDAPLQVVESDPSPPRPDEPTPTDTPKPNSPSGHPVDHTRQAVLGKLSIHNDADGFRVLKLMINAPEPLRTQLELQRAGKRLARKAAVTISGKRSLKLRLPRQTSAGYAHLQLKLRDEYGNTRTIAREIYVPADRHSPQPIAPRPHNGRTHPKRKRATRA